MNAASDHQYLTPAELSVRLRGTVTTGTLANWRSRGTGPRFIRAGKGILYPLDEVVAWERRNTVSSTAEYGRPQ